MIPILFEPKTTNFNSNGLGRLSEAVSCVITEARNGEFELEMYYPIDGILYEDIQLGSLIYAAPGEGRNLQAFSVYKISKPLRGIITIGAEHISYQLSYIPCAPFTANTVTDALAGLKNHAAEDCPYTFWTDKTSSGDFVVTVPSSIRSRLGGVQGSIMDVYGGEYEFDMFTVRLWNARGADHGVALRYGKNIIDMQQEENIANTITGIYPYWTGNDGEIVELPEKVISSEAAEKFPYPRTIPVDLSSNFKEKPTVENLRQEAQKYMESHDIGIPAVNISVSFYPTWQAEEAGQMQSVKLCDTVTVEYEKLGVSATAKVIKTVYNVLKDRYDSIEIGEAKTNLADTIVAQSKQIEEAPTKGFMDQAIANATNWITGVNGGYVVFHKNAEGQPYEILIMDSPDIETAKNVWRWNQNGWGHSKTGYNGPYTLAATLDGGIVADFITTGSLNANLITTGVLNADLIKAGTMQANRIKGGTLTLGGSENGDGVCTVLNSAGTEVVRLDKDGLHTSNAQITGGGIDVLTDYKQAFVTLRSVLSTGSYTVKITPSGITISRPDVNWNLYLDASSIECYQNGDELFSFTPYWVRAKKIVSGNGWSGSFPISGSRVSVEDGIITGVELDN